MNLHMDPKYFYPFYSFYPFPKLPDGEGSLVWLLSTWKKLLGCEVSSLCVNKTQVPTFFTEYVFCHL